MICFDCARPHPDYREPEKPIALTEAACCVCKEVKGCVPNAKVGLPERFPTVAEAFGMIADQVREMQRRKGEAQPSRGKLDAAELFALIESHNLAMRKAEQAVEALKSRKVY